VACAARLRWHLALLIALISFGFLPGIMAHPNATSGSAATGVSASPLYKYIHPEKMAVQAPSPREG
jgi:hypothetical protein